MANSAANRLDLIADLTSRGPCWGCPTSFAGHNRMDLFDEARCAQAGPLGMETLKGGGAVRLRGFGRAGIPLWPQFGAVRYTGSRLFAF